MIALTHMRTPNDIRLAEKVPEVKTNIKTHPCGLLELLQKTLFKMIFCLGGPHTGRTRSCLRKKKGMNEGCIA